jgi:hypothetical protein
MMMNAARTRFLRSWSRITLDIDTETGVWSRERRCGV